MDKQILVEPAEKNRRLISTLIDILTMLASTLAIYFFMLYVAIGPANNYVTKNERVQEIKEEYQITYESGRPYTDYQEVLYKFYVEYYGDEIEERLSNYFPDEKYASHVHMYNVFVMDLDIDPHVEDGTYRGKYFQYQLDEEGNVLINEPGVLRNDYQDEKYANTLSSFMYGRYVELEGLLKTYNKEYIALCNSIGNIELISRSTGIGVTVIAFAIIIPLCLKHGRTLGNKSMGIVIVNSKNGFTIKKYKVFIRALSLYGLPIGGVIIGNVYSIISMVVFPLFVSTLLMLFRNDEQDLGDLISRTIAVDIEASLLFKSAGEASLYMKKAENQIVEDPEFLEALSNTKKIEVSENKGVDLANSKKDKNS